MKMDQRSDNRNKDAERPGSQSAARALSILDLLGESAQELGVREMARQLGLAPSIVQRLIRTLTDYGYVERAADGQKYRIGYRAFQIGRSFLTHTDLHAASLPELRDMAERQQINAYLGVLRDRSVVYLEAIQSSGPIAIISTPGSRALLHSTAFGKVLLAELPDDTAAALLGPEPFLRLTSKTKTTLAACMDDVREVRRTGYGISDEENLDNVFAAGAVVRDATGTAVAAVSGAVPRHQLDAAGVEKLCATVVGAAQRISRRLGAPSAALRPPARMQAVQSQ
jgi:DNA-binding IclR family transcriptional regulator